MVIPKTEVVDIVIIVKMDIIQKDHLMKKELRKILKIS